MPNIKEVKNRIGSVKSTQQLTKAMKMVAAAKLKRAQDKVTELRPYSNKLNEILSNLSDSISNVLFEQRDVENKLFIVVASDKGLCGSFNSNIFNGGLLGNLASNFTKVTNGTFIQSELDAITADVKSIGSQIFDQVRKNKAGDLSFLSNRLDFNKSESLSIDVSNQENDLSYQ